MILESQRQLYNAALEERIDAYRKAAIRRTYWDQAKALTVWRQSDSDASALPVNLQRGTLKRLDGAYQAFFRRVSAGEKPGFPRFRGASRFDSFGFLQFAGISLRNGALRFKGMPGSLRVHMHRPLPNECDIRSCTIKRAGEKWLVGFVVKIATPDQREGKRAIGVDLGISTFATLSNGNTIPSLRAARSAERRLRVAQRAFVRKHKGSRGYRKARAAVRQCHAKVARRRANHLHQASAELVRNYEVIVVEALNVRGLVLGLLAKHIHDASWSAFISMLRYKAEWAGARLIEVAAHGTSRDCSNCGAAVPKKLSQRRHDCPECGLSIDRDLNASLNILCRAGMGPGLRNAATGTRAGGNLALGDGVAWNAPSSR